MPTTIPDLMDATSAAEFLGVSAVLVRRYCKLDKIKAERIGNQWVIPKRELIRFAKKPRLVGNPNFRRK